MEEDKKAGQRRWREDDEREFKGGWGDARRREAVRGTVVTVRSRGQWALPKSINEVRRARPTRPWGEGVEMNNAENQ